MAYKDKYDERLKKSRREWYYRNKEKQAAYKKKRDKETREFINSLKVACEQCGWNGHPYGLHFHHLDPSQKSIALSSAVTIKGWGKDRILEEVAKCKVLCGNCHIIEHWGVGHGDQPASKTVGQGSIP